YTVVEGRGPAAAEVTWHATVAYMVTGAVTLGLVALFGGGLAPFFDAPNAAQYIPGMALGLYIRRLGAMPERVLSMQMRLRPAGIAAMVGELSFTITSLTLAALGYGGWSIVIGKLVQSCIVVAIL